MHHDSSSFTYRFQPKLEITKIEQLYILRALAKKGVIKLKQYVVPDAFMHNDGIESQIYNGNRFVITASKEKLEQYSASPAADHDAKEDVKPKKKIRCKLLLNGRDFMLKIGDYPEQQIGKLNEGSTVYDLTLALFRSPSGSFVSRIDVVPTYRNHNLWQAYTRNGYSYLKPFFSSGDNRIAMWEEVELTAKEILLMLPKIAEKYRNNFDFIGQDLRR